MKENVLIFGDSYSTFKGFIPDGYIAYYTAEGRPETDVTKVEQTWWHQVVKEAGLNLVLNNSWSGSTICYTGYEGKDCSKTSSFICRLQKLIDEDFFKQNNIDKVFIISAGKARKSAEGLPPECLVTPKNVGGARRIYEFRSF